MAVKARWRPTDKVGEEGVTSMETSDAPVTWSVSASPASFTPPNRSDYVFGDHSLYARARMLHQRYALTLLCMPDLGWVADGFLRDSADAQLKIHDMMTRELTTLGLPFAQVRTHAATHWR